MSAGGADDGPVGDDRPRVSVERDGHVLVIGLDRPEKRNAADLRMLRELSLAYGLLDRDPDLRAGLLIGHGEHFTAGLDLGDVAPAWMNARSSQAVCSSVMPRPTGVIITSR